MHFSYVKASWSIWKFDVVPIQAMSNQVFNMLLCWCRLRDSNSRPLVYKTTALPTELNRLGIIGNCFLCTANILKSTFLSPWSRWRDSNSRSSAPKADGLNQTFLHREIYIYGLGGQNRTAMFGFGDQRNAIIRHRELAPQDGIEPPTNCSTSELLGNGAGEGIRTLSISLEG